MNNAPHPKPISLDKARLDKLIARRDAAERALAGVRAKIDDYRRAYSAQHRYCIVLTLDQLLLSVSS